MHDIVQDEVSSYDPLMETIASRTSAKEAEGIPFR